MSLFDGIPLPYEEPQPVAPAKPAEPSYLLTIRRASNGQEVLLCSVNPPPASAIAEAAKLDKALFVYDEIPALRLAAADGGSHAVDIIIETRRVMGFGGPIEHRRAA